MTGKRVQLNHCMVSIEARADAEGIEVLFGDTLIFTRAWTGWAGSAIPVMNETGGRPLPLTERLAEGSSVTTMALD